MAKTSARKKSSSSRMTNGSPPPKAFINNFYSNSLKNDLELISAKDRESIANSVWQLAQQRLPGKVKMRLFNPSPAQDGWTVDHTVLEIINDDMPFIVDSITGALQARGLTIHVVLHPVLLVRRDSAGYLLEAPTLLNSHSESALNDLSEGAKAESVIHIQFDHCLDQTFLNELKNEMIAVLNDVWLAVEDWPKMREKMGVINKQISSLNKDAPVSDIQDIEPFLKWLDTNNFTFLGYRYIELKAKQEKLISINVLPGSGLGILHDRDLRLFGGLRDSRINRRPINAYSFYQSQPIFITKTNLVARVHRCVPMDAVFFRHYDPRGNLLGEHLFVGLFTSQSYAQNPREVPFLGRKIERVIARSGMRAGSHDGRSLIHVLNAYPRDELFQISEDELFTNALGIVQLQERARVTLFTRLDPFGRFINCLIFIPREQYYSGLRQKFSNYLEKAINAKLREWHIRVDDKMLARAFVSLSLTDESIIPDMGKIEIELRNMCRNWNDNLRDLLAKTYGEATALALLRRYGKSFPRGYCDATDPSIAVGDIHHLEKIRAAAAKNSDTSIVDVRLNDKDGRLHLKLFQLSQPIILSDMLPLLENCGLKVEYMGGPYEITPEDGSNKIYLHEFVGRPAHTGLSAFQTLKPMFEEAFKRIWQTDVENDLFNALTLRAGLAWRDIVLMRTLARYLRQLRIPYSHEMIAQTFIKFPGVAQKTMALFTARHNPNITGNRSQRVKAIEAEIDEALLAITVLEEDRIIRRYLNLIQASLRTNFFQPDAQGKPKTYISIKFDSRAVDFMPLPKPLYEIFVYSTRTEAVHLRGGRVARGGIRWSDRREDFRNEILGLMKAQMVKNSVIVPVGSKGGFIVKRPPAEADKLLPEGIACYRIMMCGLLDITDNRVNGKIVPPPHVVRHDQDDPYLVVAADKGTAKFSDIANSIAQEYKFWLDDAFASGGSAGYDHKGMAITARGAWEAIKRHFRELGKDIQTTDFTCIGVGDMSGDVFGNGMLLSKHLRLLGAFDHRHIFCDPNPDASMSFAERQRLFKLARSSWADYDTKKMSKGGGIFARGEKSIRMTPEIKKAFGIMAESLTPAELIQAMLRADVELLYFGGIGTYVKATSETHEDVGDRATDALRIDGKDIRAKVIGEGANLGMTQRGRIEFALKGGRLNTDAIDNSAGVDTSDHEVNIKVLLRKCLDNGTMTLPIRNKLLSSMTDDVASLVLRDNYLQTQALSVSETRAAEHLQLHVRTMHLLEKSGLLNRAVEFLPNSNEIAEYQRLGRGLTRPELAVMLAYAKIWLYEQLLDSDLPEDPFMQGDLITYFPEALRQKFGKEIPKHQLAREIIVTAVTNSIVNRAGTNFVLSLADQTGASAATIARAYLVVREAFGLRDLWRIIEALDNQISAKTQIAMHAVTRDVIDKSVLWFLTQDAPPKQLTPVIATYRDGLKKLSDWLNKNAKSGLLDSVTMKSQQMVTDGVPASLATSIAILPTMATSLDILHLAFRYKISIGDAAEIFFNLGQRLHIDWLFERARDIQAQTPWQREAAKAIIQDISAIQCRVTETILKSAGGPKSSSLAQRLAHWIDKNNAKIERYDTQVSEWRSFGAVDIATLTLASRQLSGL
jgi:glutamate dehydrogenase